MGIILDPPVENNFQSPPLTLAKTTTPPAINNKRSPNMALKMSHLAVCEENKDQNELSVPTHFFSMIVNVTLPCQCK